MGAERQNAARSAEPASGPPTLDTVDGRPPESEALELDRIIHERVRLGIVSSLAVNGRLGFTDLRDLLGITDGNLKSHASRLEDAGYIDCAKATEGRATRTEYYLTESGREAFQAYVGHMEAIIQATRQKGEEG